MSGKDLGEYTVIYEEVWAGYWHARVEEVPGCYTHGHTIEQAEKQIVEALNSFVADAATATLVQKRKAFLPLRATRGSEEGDQSKQHAFIKQLAKFLVEGQAGKSIYLQAGNPLAKEWAALRAYTPISGYVTVEEAEKILTEFLA